MDFSKLQVFTHASQLERGYRNAGYLGWRHPESPYRFAAAAPPPPPIPRAAWSQKIVAASGRRLGEVCALPAKDQNGLLLCWAYGSVRAAEYKRILDDEEPLDLSPESVAGPCTRWRNQGGYASEAFAQLETGGACESRFMDAPHSLVPQRWNPGWVANAASHLAYDWQDLSRNGGMPTFDDVITALLNGNPVAAGLAWWGHLVCFTAAVLLGPGVAPPNTPDGNTVAVVFQNTWGNEWPRPGDNGFAILSENVATPDGAAVPILIS